MTSETFLVRSPHQLLHSRTRVRPRYALMPLEGFPTSRLPNWTDAEVRILAAPALGAAFVEYLFTIQAGGGATYKPDGRTQSFFYVHSGTIELAVGGSAARPMTEGAFALLPPNADFSIKATKPTLALALRKAYEPAAGVAMPPPVFGNQADVRGEIYLGNPGARLQTLIPDELAFDLAMNIFTFDPGHCLPYVETHVMEHGLYFLAGKGVYYLGEEWMEVEAGDFIWMGPYCPQAFYATGPVASKYIYYKNVNREIDL